MSVGLGFWDAPDTKPMQTHYPDIINPIGFCLVHLQAL